MRGPIVGSWWRSARAGLSPESFQVPFDSDIDDTGRLAWAAAPVLSGVAQDLDGTRIGLLLTDDRGSVVARRAGSTAALNLLDDIQLAPGFGYGEERVGTNAIGTALQRREPTLVEAQQHFADALTGMACAAMTVTDPATGRVLGVVDLSCAAGDSSPLMLPLVKRAVWEIEQRLLDAEGANERLLQEHFLRARRATRAPLVAVSARSVLVNAAASSQVDAADRLALWDYVVRVLRGGGSTGAVQVATGDLVAFRCEAVMDGEEVVGALLRIEPAAAPSGPAATRHGRSSGRSSGRDFGWNSLTQAELAVAMLVSEGVTNREAAARLYVSPNTIDFHLRQLVRKLDVASRVELTRVV
ncbi:MAG: modulated sigma54 specific transcriptional regulator, Fis family, partial [Frankiales bacterium]|nr:modulated sigma54 specific transcriptional regulator, Fis family [Frankiales bacterium]